MDQRNVRIVVGRGDPSGTDIRATLEDDGFQVAGEASSAAELARLVSADPPDVVVLDDTIGVAAVQAVAELAPDAKLVVIWPAAVLPIAGATRIDAAEVHTALAPAVAAAAGFAIGMTTIDRPEWIDAASKDPATLREMLAERGGVPAQPSVTELQRPHAHRAPATGWRRRRTAAVAVAAAAATVGAPRTPAAAADTDTDATVNRRLGIVALGGAVAAGALMIALSFGRTPPTLVTAERFVPGVSAPSNFVPNPLDGSTTGAGSPGAPNGGQQGGAGGANGGTGADGGAGAGAPTIGAGGTSAGTSGSGTTGGRTGQQFPQRAGVGDGGQTTGNGSTSGNGGQGAGQQGGAGGAASGPGKSGEHNPHGGPPGQSDGSPGKSGEHNPHGGPPGQSDGSPGKSAEHRAHPRHR